MAQKWADEIARRGCALGHSDTSSGENLAAATTGSLSPSAMVELWYREVESYRFRRGGFSMKTGHFTQLVWRSTTTVGCGKSQCRGLDVWICNYDPAGNVQGLYRDEVLPATCEK